MKAALRESRDLGRLLAVPPSDRSIVFYAEDTFTYVQYEGYLQGLIGAGHTIKYVTSAPNDPLIAAAPPGLEVFYIDKQVARLMDRLDSAVLALTMPDLGRFHVPAPVSTKTAYVFHSLNSTHTAYRNGAFDHYDAFLCTGPHHVREIAALRRHRGLPMPEIFEVGYYKLDRIAHTHATYVKQRPDSTTVLVAPSWGQANLLEAHGRDVIASLRSVGLAVIVRPHPQFFHSLYPEGSRIVDDLEREYRADDQVVFERSIDTEDSFHEADLMVTDWSGAAFEFALGTQRPVLFVDTPQKLFNADWHDIGLGSFERSMRTEVGRIIDPREITYAGESAVDLISKAQDYKDTLAAVREAAVFNVGEAGLAGAQAILALADGRG